MIHMQTSQIHIDAEHYREAGKFLESLQSYTQSYVEYINNKDYFHAIHTLLGSALTYKHLYVQTKESAFLSTGIHNCILALRLADDYRVDTIYHYAHVTYGELLILEDNYLQAVAEYEKALAHITLNFPENIAERGRILEHLAFAESRLGRSVAVQHIEQALEFITHNRSSLPQNEDGDYVFDAWLSGAYLNAARIYNVFDTSKREEYVQKARILIEGNTKLVLRKSQLIELEAQLQSKTI
jgi:tetratricopeptide (TPR) repeat protein